jgi:hypothetical protein
MSFDQLDTDSEITKGFEKLNSRSSASTREPMPHKGNIDILPLVISDLQERDKVGRKKYGTTLQSNNGRNALMDAYQEALDLCMYLRQVICETESRKEQ